MPTLGRGIESTYIRLAVVLGLLILTPGTMGHPQKPDPCDQQGTFCWYGPYTDGTDEVDAWGETWIPQDSSEKTLHVITGIRCVKKLRVCLKSSGHDVAGKVVTHIEILPIRDWSLQQISADMEDKYEPCEKDSYLLNKMDHTVLMISSPGPRADKPGCAGVLGKPRTVVYTLR
jgi:hypothetical protein